MIQIRLADGRGLTQLGWLKSQHSFSFGDYYDPDHNGFGTLRVINEDVVAPGQGFGKHPHRNMEILSIVLSGTLEHKDSMGNGSRIQAGDVQRMSAGTGVTHSEFNPSADEAVHFLQVWFVPNKQGMVPSYDQKSFDEKGRMGQLQLIVSPSGRDGSLTIHQNVDIYAGTLAHPTQAFDFVTLAGRRVWVQVAKGQCHMNGHPLKAGDGAAVMDEERLTFTNGEDAEIYIFDMAI
ncbi:MAG: pirin family protein [Pseudomonadota bacterium]|nr:pirin family protein [Pseudomonadota bacterium]